MYNIKKLNAISGAVYDHLPKDQYLVSSHIEEADVDAYLVRSADCNEMQFGKNVLAIARAGAGTNNIPSARCAEEGIVVFNTPGANANAVKEMVLCGMLVAARNVIPAVEWARTLEDQGDAVPKLVESGKKNFVGPELAGKTLGVIGLGAIGVLVANAAIAIGMNVIGYDPFVSVENAWHLSRSVNHALDMSELLANSDYITVHVPLTDKTRGYISSPEFAKMKQGVILMNFARNGIIRESSLFEALESGKVAKYVTDFPDAKLVNRENVIAIPHLGASTPESEENCAIMASKQLRDFIENGSIKNSVNMPECILGKTSNPRLTIIHKNVQGIVGKLTAIISDAGLNIEEMTNKSRGDIAYTVFDLNAKLEDLEAMKAIEGVIKVREI